MVLSVLCARFQINCIKNQENEVCGCQYIHAADTVHRGHFFIKRPVTAATWAAAVCVCVLKGGCVPTYFSQRV